MSHIIIDRRKNDKGKSSVNRQRFVERVKSQVKNEVKDIIRKGNIKDIFDDKGKKIKVSGKGLTQPYFRHNRHGGIKDGVAPGNKQFQQGDRVNRPPTNSGSGKGEKASPEGDGEDSFTFELTRDEFLNIFFEDLELPDLVKKDIIKIEEYQMRRAGFTVDGNPSRLNVVRSMKQSKSRRMALRSPKKKRIKELQEELKHLDDRIEFLLFNNEPAAASVEEKRKVEIIEEIKILKKKVKAVPFIDDIDLRYNRWEKVPVPSTQAVMFCIMDVSSSMGEWEKEMAKRFFMLLYLFLIRNYEKVELVFIRHHTVASEVNENDFFYAMDSGGTLVSPALELMSSIIDQRYPLSQWNVFGCQASDGDNWGEDSSKAVKLLTEKILPICQYYAYVEIDKNGGQDSDLWPHYEDLKQNFKNFEMTTITDVSEIYNVFRGLFEKRERNKVTT